MSENRISLARIHAELKHITQDIEDLSGLERARTNEDELQLQRLVLAQKNLLDQLSDEIRRGTESLNERISEGFRDSPATETEEINLRDDIQYENFFTVDWQREKARDRRRLAAVQKEMVKDAAGFLKGWYDEYSGRICELLTGMAAGATASCIDTGTEWMGDLKFGVCRRAFWYNRHQCCWLSNTTDMHDDKCNEWSDWASFIQDGDMSPKKSFIYSYLMYVVCCLMMAGLASCLVNRLAPYASGSGIPEIKCILSGFIMHGYLGKMTLLVMCATMVLAVSSGLSLGKEGPMVHLACCFGNIFSYWFPRYGKNEARKREIFSAAAAAGVSIAFNAPIGGVLFSLEEASYYFPTKTLWRSFFCAMVAALILRAMNPLDEEHPVHFYMNINRGWMYIELAPFALLGLLGGVIGTGFVFGNVVWIKFKKKYNLVRFPVVEVLLVTLVTSLVKYPNELMRTGEADLISRLFTHCTSHDTSLLCDYQRSTESNPPNKIIGFGPGIYKSLHLLLISLFAVWVLTIFTFGIKVPAGIFVPSLTMGAIAGRIVGIGMQSLSLKYRESFFFRFCSRKSTCFSPSLYAMIGAAACLAGVTRMTVSLVVVMFELTGSITYIVPLMLAVITSKWIGGILYKDGIYDAHILLSKYPFIDKKTDFSDTTPISEIVKKIRMKGKRPLKYITEEGMTADEIERIILDTVHTGFPVVISEENPFLVGYVTKRDIRRAIDNVKKTMDVSRSSRLYFITPENSDIVATEAIVLGRIVDRAPLTVSMRTPMESVIDLFRTLGMQEILVTDPGGLLAGVVIKKDIVKYTKKLK